MLKAKVLRGLVSRKVPKWPGECILSEPDFNRSMITGCHLVIAVRSVSLNTNSGHGNKLHVHMNMLVSLLLPPISGAWEYIESTRDVVRDLERRVRMAKANVDTMVATMAKWSEAPLYQRKDDKKDLFLNLDVRKHTHSEILLFHMYHMYIFLHKTKLSEASLAVHTCNKY